jgi:hypothetical protein
MKHLWQTHTIAPPELIPEKVIEFFWIFIGGSRCALASKTSDARRTKSKIGDIAGNWK